MAHVTCIGGACIDRKYHLSLHPQPGTSNPAHARRSFGGVARNVAENLARLGVHTALLCVIGDDENGLALLDDAQRAGIDAALVVRDSRHVTAEYCAVVDPAGELVIGASDMHAVDALDIEDVEKRWNAIAQSRWVFMDCNVPAHVLAWCIDRARESRFKLALDAVSEPKVRRLPRDLRGVDLLVLNEKEAAMYLGEDCDAFFARTPIERARAVRACGASAVILTRGAAGVVSCTEDAREITALTARCVDVTGAGDALIAATIHRLLQGDDLCEAARVGSLCAGLTVESPASVRPDLSAALLDAQKGRIPA